MVFRMTDGPEAKITYKGIEYEFKLTVFDNIDSYANIMVVDKTHDERYMCYGYLEINGHRIQAKWEREYDNYRDNWVCTKDLVITIN